MKRVTLLILTVLLLASCAPAYAIPNVRYTGCDWEAPRPVHRDDGGWVGSIVFDNDFTSDPVGSTYTDPGYDWGGTDSGSWDTGGFDSWDSGGYDSGAWDSGGWDSGSWDSGGSDAGSW